MEVCSSRATHIEQYATWSVAVYLHPCNGSTHKFLIPVHVVMTEIIRNEDILVLSGDTLL
jgi:hypothetical protein